MTKSHFFKLLYATLLALLTCLFACTKEEETPETEETNSPKEFPQSLTIDIPASLSASTPLKSSSIKSSRLKSDDVYDGNEMYHHLRNFIGIAEGGAELLNILMDGIRTYQLNQPLDLYYKEVEDSNRVKHLIVKEDQYLEGTSYEFKLSIQDSLSEANDDLGLGLQIYWNTNPVSGVAIIKPYNLDHKSAETGMYRIDYNEGVTEYDATMVVSISGLPATEADKYSVDNIKLFVGKKGDILDIYGNSNHPYSYFGETKPSEVGYNYAFVASANDTEDYACAEIGLPLSSLDTDSRQEILKTYSVKNVLIQTIAKEHNMTTEAVEAFITEHNLMINTKPPGYFENGEFLSSDTIPDEKFETLVDHLDALGPFNPSEISNLEVTFGI